MEKYFQTDELQAYIDWVNILPMSRHAGGHDDQMKGLFTNAEVIAHWNEGDYQGRVATCVKLNDGKYAGCYLIYNDYYGSCSGCDAWDGARDEEVRKMCIDLSNSAYVFKTIEDVKEFLIKPTNDDKKWSSWSGSANGLLGNINSGKIDE